MNKTYLVSDLASELQIPRTTVNDWLRIYGDYLESEVRGKRRVYPERTLAILREIKARRDDGEGQGPIEAMLAERYGLRPEPIAVPENTEVPEKTGKTETPAAEIPAGGALVRPDPELKELFLRWQQNDLEQRERARRSSRRILWCMALLLVLFGMVLCGTFVYFSFRLTQSEKFAAQRQFAAQQAVDNALKNLAEVRRMQEKAEQTADARSEELKRLTVTLDRTRADYQRESSRLAGEMKEQKLAADKALAELRRTEEGRRNAEIAELKRAFADHQKTLLKEMEAAKLARTEAEQALNAMKAAGAARTEAEPVREKKLNPPVPEKTAVPEMSPAEKEVKK